MQSKVQEDTYNTEPTVVNKIRLDQFKTPILKKAKVHRVVFRDECQKGNKISDIYIVENWKKLNALTQDSNESCCSLL